MKSSAAIAASLLSAVLVVAAACAAPANPRPDAAAADPADPSIIWDYRQVTVVPELLDKREMAAAIGRSYPTGLRAQGVTGAVTLELVTSREGVVESVSVLNASDPQFGDARPSGGGTNAVPARFGARNPGPVPLHPSHPFRPAALKKIISRRAAETQREPRLLSAVSA